MRGLLVGLIGLTACAPASEDCPPGALGCPCLEGSECNAGFECRSDVCRDDEDPTGTSSSSSSSTTVTSTSPSTTDPPPPTTTDMTTIGPGSVGPVSTDPTVDPTVTGGGTCACGWSDTDNAYGCGFDLPSIGPVGKGSPDCISVASDVACDTFDPPIDQYGCCGGGGALVVSCQEGLVKIDDCTVVAPGICEPT